MLVAAQNFSDDPNVFVMVMIVAVLGLTLLMVVGGEMGRRAEVVPEEEEVQTADE